MVSDYPVTDKARIAHQPIPITSLLLTFQHVTDHGLGIHNIAMNLRNYRTGLHDVAANIGRGSMRIPRQWRW